MTASTPEQPLVLRDHAAWRDWLLEHEAHSDGEWLVLAKKGTREPTSLSYQDALEEALSSGWIDGQRRSRDEETFLQRFTPRRPRSIWSKRNVSIIARLEEEGRMRERGRAEVERAREDGRWDAAYAGPATAEVPPELTAALAEDTEARTAFEALSGSARYSVLHPVLSARDDRARERAVARAVLRLRGEGPGLRRAGIDECAGAAAPASRVLPGGARVARAQPRAELPPTTSANITPKRSTT